MTLHKRVINGTRVVVKHCTVDDSAALARTAFLVRIHRRGGVEQFSTTAFYYWEVFNAAAARL